MTAGRVDIGPSRSGTRGGAGLGGMSRQAKFAAGSIGVGLLVLSLKAAAYVLTGSVALYSDALESVINLVTASVALYTIRIAAQPADDDHPYGHTKAEYFSAVLCGVLIVVAALLIFGEAWRSWDAARVPRAPWDGIAVNVVASIVNATWAVVLLREGGAARSHALLADGRHLLVDVATSVGVVAGVAASVATGVAILDPAVAALVGVNVLWSGWRVMRESVGGLMDEAVPADTLARIRDLISANADGAIEAHDLRTRLAGRTTFVDFHLVVPGHLSVSSAHDICDRLERALRAEIADAQVTIHVEPEDKAKHSGIVVV